MPTEFSGGGSPVMCAECDAHFRLEEQWYYDNLCPECKAGEDGEVATWPVCIRCFARIPPEEREYIYVLNRRTQERERTAVCAECEI